MPSSDALHDFLLFQLGQDSTNHVPAHRRTGAFKIDQRERSGKGTDGHLHQGTLCPSRARISYGPNRVPALNAMLRIRQQTVAAVW